MANNTTTDFYLNFFESDGKIHIKRIDEQGAIRYDTDHIEPVLYEEDTDYNPSPTYPSMIGGKPLRRVAYKNIFQARAAIKKAREQSEAQGNSECLLHGFAKFDYKYIDDRWPGIDGVLHDKNRVRCLNFDIEVEKTGDRFSTPDEASERINAITAYDGQYFHVFGLQPVDVSLIPQRDQVIYHNCEDDESLLLKKFIDLWSSTYPDIVTGWNIKFFDIPYLVNRVNNVLGTSYMKRFSPWDSVTQKTTRIMNRDQTHFDIAGVSVLDYLDLYKKFTYTLTENFKLDTIAHLELGTKKLDYSEYSSLHELYLNDYQKFIEYNIKDVELVDRIDRKKKLISLVITLAYSSKVNFEDVFMDSVPWDCMISSYAEQVSRVQVPAYNAIESKGKIVGGYVKPPITGKHKWIVSFDLTSLYPSLIMQYNISPEKLIGQPIELWEDDVLAMNDTYRRAYENAKELNATMACNGALFQTDERGILPALMDKFFALRKDAKNEMKKWAAESERLAALGEDTSHADDMVATFDTEQMARKVALNSAYGSISSRWFRLYSTVQGMAITTSGRAGVQWAAKHLNEYVSGLMGDDKDRIVAIDTDSCLLAMDDIVDRFCESNDDTKIVDFIDNVCKGKLHDVIDNSYAEFAKNTLAYRNTMDMKREVIGPGIFIRKKRYIIKVYDNEGVRYAEPQYKMMGIEAIRSTTPEFCKEHIRECIRLFFDADEPTMVEYIGKVYDSFLQQTPGTIASTTGVHDIEKYLDKQTRMPVSGCPYHVKAAIAHNNLLNKNGLTGKYEAIASGDKVRIVALKKHNPIKYSSSFGFNGEIPEEMGIEPYVDYDEQFEKVFMSPVRTILETVGWKEKEEVDMFSFM